MTDVSTATINTVAYFANTLGPRFERGDPTRSELFWFGPQGSPNLFVACLDIATEMSAKFPDDAEDDEALVLQLIGYCSVNGIGWARGWNTTPADIFDLKGVADSNARTKP